MTVGLSPAIFEFFMVLRPTKLSLLEIILILTGGLKMLLLLLRLVPIITTRIIIMKSAL